MRAADEILICLNGGPGSARQVAQPLARLVSLTWVNIEMTRYCYENRDFSFDVPMAGSESLLERRRA